MISVRISTTAEETHTFFVQVTGSLRNPRVLNDALGRRLVKELHKHFLARNSEPNKMAAPKTNYWAGLIEHTQLAEVSDSGAIVSIADVRYRIQLFGGTIKPTGGRKFLTIPLVAEARGKRVAEYEKQSGNKLFRLPGRFVLCERSDQGDRTTTQAIRGRIRSRSGDFRNISIRSKSTMRAVFALSSKVTIKRDPRALPPQALLLDALTETAGQYTARLTSRRNSSKA